MKIHGPFNNIASSAASGSGAGTRKPQGAAEPFQALLKERCQESGAAPPDAPAARALQLACSALDLLEGIAAQMASGATARDMAPAHERLARQATELRRAAEALEPQNPLKGVLSETAALSFLQLWRYEQGELS